LSIPLRRQWLPLFVLGRGSPWLEEDNLLAFEEKQTKEPSNGEPRDLKINGRLKKWQKIGAADGNGETPMQVDGVRVEIV
jgi:hypothetical protein